MKKTLIILALVIALGAGSIVAFGESNITPFGRNFNQMPNRTEFTEEQMNEMIKDRDKFREERMEYKKEAIEKSFTNKEITQEQYNIWLNHFNEMEKFHKENGFFHDGGFGGGCRGNGKGFNGGGKMMRGYKSNL